MTEYTNISRAYTVAEPDLQQHDQESREQLAFELKKIKERQKKLEDALHAVFPLGIYTQARPDLEETFDGEARKIIDHFVSYGINEIDIKAESQKHKLGLYQHVKEAAALLANELKTTKHREEKLEAALHKVFPINLYTQVRPDVEASCDGEVEKILDHFVSYGINETDI